MLSDESQGKVEKSRKIRNISPVSSTDFAKKIFNLNGVRLTEPQSGLNIINGKVVLAK